MALRDFKVLIGNCEPSASALLQLFIKSACEGRAIPQFTVADRLEELLTLAESEAFDFCILMLENIQVGKGWSQDRIERVIESIRLLKTNTLMPVLAISPYRDGPGFEQRVLEAGADWFLDYLSPFEELERAVVTHLDAMCGRQPNAQRAQ